MFHIDPHKEVIVRTLSASTPHEAALRSVSKGEGPLVVIVTRQGKVHVYRGEKVALSSPNTFEQRRGITHRSKVMKLCYFDWGETVEERSISSLCSSIREAIGES